MKKLLQTVSFVFLLLLPLLGRAQQNRITGRVVDARTKAPISFASISLRVAGTGTLTNESGYFQMPESGEFKPDSLVFTTLGYCRRAVLVGPGQSEDLRIEMNKGCLDGINIIYCPVKPSAAIRQAPSTSNGAMTGLPGTQYAFFIENDNRKQFRKMRSVSFYIGENGLPTAPFRARIYQVDHVSHAPAADLLAELLVLEPNRSGQWYTSDLSRYDIAVPKDGYFIALDFRQSAGPVPQPNKDKYVPSGQIMRPAFDFKDSSMWAYSPEKGWVRAPQSSSSRRYNAMVKLEVEARE